MFFKVAETNSVLNESRHETGEENIGSDVRPTREDTITHPGQEIMLANEIAIETQELVKRFSSVSGWRGLFSSQHRTALDCISVQIHRGEVFGLLGPNGVGKTTLMKILATLVLPNSGRAWVNGLDVVRQSKEVRRLIGVVYGDERTFFWRLSVRENLRFYAALYRLPARKVDSRIDELLEKVGLVEAADIRMYQFSTGMKQRAAIARGLLSEPQLLFLDEPTRSLDPIGTHEIHELIRRHLISDSNRTILIATNNMGEAEALCDRVALLGKGRVRLMGTVEELRRTVRSHDRHVIMVGMISTEDIPNLEAVPGVIWARAEATDEARWPLELAVEHDSNAVPEVIRLLVRAGGSVWSCVPREPSLDDVFRLTLRRDTREGHASTLGVSS